MSFDGQQDVYDVPFDIQIDNLHIVNTVTHTLVQTVKPTFNFIFLECENVNSININRVLIDGFIGHSFQLVQCTSVKRTLIQNIEMRDNEGWIGVYKGYYDGGQYDRLKQPYEREDSSTTELVYSYNERLIEIYEASDQIILKNFSFEFLFKRNQPFIFIDDLQTKVIKDKDSDAEWRYGEFVSTFKNEVDLLVQNITFSNIFFV